MRKSNRLMAMLLVASQIAVVGLPTIKSFATELNTPLVDGNTGMAQVVSVNGNKLEKSDIVNVGDTVTFDVIVTPGNIALFKSFKDTLPEGLKFNPNSQYAFTVNAVNNDGSMGEDITKEGESVINGRSWTWSPKDPYKFFFLGKNSKYNRLIFHVTTIVENAVEPDTVLENIATIEFDKPKDKGDPPPPLEDKASVKIPATPKTPSIRKSVYEEKDGKIDAKLPSGAKLGTDNVAGEFVITSDMAYDKMKLELSKFIVEADKHKVDTKKLSELVYGLNKASDGSYRKEILTEFKRLIIEYNKAVRDELGNSEKKDEVYDDIYKEEALHDNIKLDKIEKKYSYVVNVHVPSQSVSKSLEIEDFVENVQKIDLENVKIYNDKGEDVTSQGKLNKVPWQHAQDKITWTANESFIKYLKETNTDKNLQMRITGVSVEDARNDDLERYRLGGIITIPNTSTIVFDNFRKESNKTLVRLPNPDPLGDHSIVKGVSHQDGKIVFEDGGCRCTGEKLLKTYTNVGDLKLKLLDLIDNTNIDVDTKAKLNDLINSLQNSATEEEKKELLKKISEKNEEIKFDEGNSEITLKSYEDYYSYNINVELNTEKIANSIEIADDLVDIQEFNEKEIKVFDSTGKNITDKFEISKTKDENVNRLSVKAKSDMVETIRNTKKVYKLQIMLYNVKLIDDDNLKEKYKVNNGLEVLNKSELIVDGGPPIFSNETKVKIEIPGTDPNKPNKPNKPDVPDPNGNKGIVPPVFKEIKPKIDKFVKDNIGKIKNNFEKPKVPINEEPTVVEEIRDDIKTGINVKTNPLVVLSSSLMSMVAVLGLYINNKKKKKVEDE